MKNTFWNQPDKRKSKHQCLNDFCIKAIEKQQDNIILFKKKPNQILIRDGNGCFKIVSKTYYLYHIKDDEYDTETEIEDECWLNEVKIIKLKYT